MQSLPSWERVQAWFYLTLQVRCADRTQTEAGGVAATQDISMVPVTIRLLAEIAAHF